MPYTDQRQPQLVAVKGEGFAPAMVFVDGSGEPEKAQQNQGPVIDVAFEVLRLKSHDGEEGSADQWLGLFDPLIEYERVAVRLASAWTPHRVETPTPLFRPGRPEEGGGRRHALHVFETYTLALTSSENPKTGKGSG